MTAIIEKIENAIREEYPELGNFTLEEVEGKRINQTRKGLVLRLEGSNICPTVYPENEGDIKEIARVLVEATKKASEMTRFVEDIKDFDKCKEKIFPMALNREKNEFYLSDKTHFSHDNVAEVFVVLSDDGEGSVTVSSSIMEMWKIDEKTLRSVAEENLRRAICIAPLRQVVKEMGVELPEENAPIPEIVVATTKSRMRGAGLIFYPQLLRENLGTEDDYYVIPSSVHELLLFPKQETERKEVEDEILSLKKMIWETNRTAVEPEEFLSDDLYFFKEGKIESLGCYQP